MNTVISTRTDSKIKINCPHCKFGSKYDASYIEDAIWIHHDIICVACGETFNLVVSIPGTEAATTKTWVVYDYRIVDPITGQALYLGEVNAPTFDEAKKLTRETYPQGIIPYIFSGDEKGFA